MKINFKKYHGSGNDFIMIDDRAGVFPILNNALIARLCDRHFGIGADGLILLQNDAASDFFMMYFNSDGKQSSMCGNGGRCIASFAFQEGIVQKPQFQFRAVDGMHQVLLHQFSEDTMRVKLQMQDVSAIKDLGRDAYELNTGSPHFVKFINTPLDDFLLLQEAKNIRYGEPYRDEGINVNFVRALDDACVDMRTYERGVEDETLSCGTGVTAAALAFSRKQQFSEGAHSVHIKTRGGDLEVHFEIAEAGAYRHVWLEGNTARVFAGELDVNL